MKLLSNLIWMCGCFHVFNAQCTVYPLVDPINATVIDITDVNMECLADNLFYNYTLLTELTLRNVSIASAPCEAFSGAPIKVLNLSYNELSVVPNLTCLAGTLTQLLLDKNENISVPGGIFSALGVLGELHLDSTNLTGFNCSSLAGTSISHLHLSYNQMTEFPAFDCMEANQLTEIYASYNRISRIAPDAVSGLIHLKKFAIGNNQVTSLAALANLTNLRTVHAGINNISDLEFIFVGANLIDLNLEQNPLVDVEGQFVNATINILTLTSTPIVNAAGINDIHGLDIINMRLMTSLRCLPTVTTSAPYIIMGDSTAHCDCCWRWIKTYNRIINSPTCSGPPELKGALLESVSLENLTCSGSSPGMKPPTYYSEIGLSQPVDINRPSPHTSTAPHGGDNETPSITATEASSIPSANARDGTTIVTMAPDSLTSTAAQAITEQPTADDEIPMHSQSITDTKTITPTEEDLKTLHQTQTVTHEPTQANAQTFQQTSKHQSSSLLQQTSAMTEPSELVSKSLATETSASPPWNVNGSQFLEWNTWTAWSGCTVSCGRGHQFSILLCDSLRMSDCNGMLHATSNFTIYYTVGGRECGLNPCPVHGYWLAWNEWDECSSVCGAGTRQRRRVCRDPENDGKWCDGKSQESQLCLLQTCGAVTRVTSEDLLPAQMYTEADKRPSAQGIGATYIIVLTLLAAVVVIVDLPTLYKHLRWCSQVLKRASRFKR